MAQYCLLLSIVATMVLYEVKGECKPYVISRIVRHWGDNYPKDILSQVVGVYTYVWLSPQFLSSGYDKVECVATILDPDTTTATSVYLYKDTKDIHLKVFRKTETNGKITITSERLPDELQYVISVEKHVIAFYQCMPKDTNGQYKPFVGIAVDVEFLHDPETILAVEAAKNTLNSLGINTGESMTPCEPEVIAIV